MDNPQNLMEALVNDIYENGREESQLGWEPYFYNQDLFKLVVTYKIEEYLGGGFAHHYHGVNRDMLVKYRQVIGRPFEGTYPWGINPAILRGKIFTVIGAISPENEEKFELALHEADPETVVIFWNTDGEDRFLPRDRNLLENFISVQILKVPSADSDYPEMIPEYIYVYTCDAQIRSRLATYRYDANLAKTGCHVHAAPMNLQRNLLCRSEMKFPAHKGSRVLLWVVDELDSSWQRALDVLVKKQGGTLVGVISPKSMSLEYDAKNIESLSEDRISSIQHDIIMAVRRGDISYKQLLERLTEAGGDVAKLLLDSIACIPGFTFERYAKLRDSKVSIFSMNCFGGIVSHTLSLPFNSPFINMYFLEDGFVRFLKDPRKYLERELILEKVGYNPDLNINYPIYRLDDVVIHMNHYANFAEAEDKFKERIQRINWDNLCVVMYTDNIDLIKQYESLPYKKKVCFTTQKTFFESAYYIDHAFDSQYGSQPLWWKVNRYGKGECWYYDIFDMLIEGKKRPLLYE